MPSRALRFIRRLLARDPQRRMTATEALEHVWYTKPAREAQALDEGLARINRYWMKRLVPSNVVLEVSYAMETSLYAPQNREPTC